MHHQMADMPTTTSCRITRTQALLKHILKTYPISSKLFAATATAEDWAGTIKYVNENEIPQKEAALEIINSNMQPDAKEKEYGTFPQQQMLQASLHLSHRPHFSFIMHER